jgi:hypothetical protein
LAPFRAAWGAGFFLAVLFFRESAAVLFFREFAAVLFFREFAAVLFFREFAAVLLADFWVPDRFPAVLAEDFFREALADFEAWAILAPFRNSCVNRDYPCPEAGKPPALTGKRSDNAPGTERRSGQEPRAPA